MCPNAETSRGSTAQRRSKGSTVGGGNKRNYTDAQEEFFRQLSPWAKPKCSTIKDTWDLALSGKLREEAISLFEEYAQLRRVKFHRAPTPAGAPAEPDAITFSDGSENAYCAVLYLWWACDQGVTVRLVESKAKLTPLDHKGDAVKAELCGAVFTTK